MEQGNKAAQSIVFIHGGGISGWMWEKQLEYFRDYHCLVPDLPEHGKSINEGKISIQDSAVRIAELIEEHANGARAYIVGHSLGAKVIVQLLSVRPELVLGAVVASALFRPISLLKLTHKHFFYRLTESMLKSDWLAALTVKQFRFPDEKSSENCRKEFQGQTADMLYRIYDELYKNLKLPEGLGKAEVPVLVAAGEKEPKAMRLSVKDMINVLPDSKGILMKKGLHTYPWVMHEEFNRIIEEWIKNRRVISDSVIYIKGIRGEHYAI